MSTYGTFGNLNLNYEHGRKEFPEEVISFILNTAKFKKDSSVLDLACGTGIATKQLFLRGVNVVGSDIDPMMIELAVQKNDPVDYFVAPALKQPFVDNSFDFITCFSAFHWFANEETLREIKRLLKDKGFFFVINKNENSDFKKNYRNIIKNFIDTPLPDIKEKYNPLSVFSNSFQETGEGRFLTTELFTLEQILQYVQSISLWNLIPETKKGAVLRELEIYFKNTLNKDGFVERPIEVVVVFGY